MYNAIITKLINVRKHSNASRLQLATVCGNQVIVGLDQKENDIGIYFPTDGKLGESFCKANNLTGYKNPKTGKREGGYFDHKRKVRTMKLRGEISDGFWIPLNCLSFTKMDLSTLKIGEQFHTIQGIRICEKYVTQRTRNSGHEKKIRKKLKQFPNFYEHIDTKQFNYYLDSIKKDSLIIITEKLHGTSQRSANIQELYDLNLFKKLVNKIVPIFKEKEYKYITGTRKVVLDDFTDENKLGYYGSNEFRKIHHDSFVGKLKKGETVYYEICGWVNPDKTIMPVVDTKKLKDKAFITKYGEKMIYSCGAKPGTSIIYVYRITMTNEDGEVFEYPWSHIQQRCQELGFPHVKELTKPFIYTGHTQELKDIVEDLYAGESEVDPQHIKEGVVVRIENKNKFDVLKSKNTTFKILEGIIKEDETTVDIEEAQDFL